MLSKKNSADNCYAALIALCEHYWKLSVLYNGLIVQTYLIYLELYSPYYVMGLIA